MRQRTFLRTAALAAGLVLLNTGCSTIMIGDSITALISNALHDRLPADTHTDGVPGRTVDFTLNPGEKTMRESVDELAPKLDPGGWLVIQDDGNTDDDDGVHTYESTVEWVGYVSTLLPDDRCIAWVMPSLWDPQVAEVARAIRDYAPQQPCYALVEWGDVVAAYPGLLHDDRHPNVTGVNVLADMIADTVR